MALPYRFTGSLSRSKGVIDAIEQQLKLLNLKPAKRVTFSFNPFQKDVDSVRLVSQFMHRDNIRETNLKCAYRTTIHNNIEEPLMTVNLNLGNTIIFKTSNLTTVEILRQFNRMITSLAKKEEKKV